MSGTARAARVLKDPRRIPRAVLRRLLPNHPKYGFEWIHLPDGSVTFQERGFVASESPTALLGRHNFEVARIHEVLGDSRPFGSSLEIGCGFGRLTPTLAGLSDQHVAVDINESALAKARSTYPAYDFRAASADSLPFDDESFDLVTTWTVLQHVRPDRVATACSEILRVLRPGGTVLLCEETRYPGTAGPKAHTWHREVADYERMLSPLQIGHSQEFPEIDRIEGLESPGRVMVWRSPEGRP